MWMNGKNFPARGFSTPPPSRKSRPFRSPKMPFSERRRSSPNSENKLDLFHVIHKVPAGDSPYVKAKQVQLIDKDPSRAVSLFWAAINAGDRVDSALKDMAVVMKQLDRSEEAIEAIKSFRHLCPYDSQESIDNVLIELYKKSGRIEEEIAMLECKLRQIEEGKVFGGKRTKPARSQGKKVQITIEQEKSRVLGNLAWAFLQLDNVCTAEEYYRKALCLESDSNKKCNLAICLILTNRVMEAKSVLQSVRASSGGKMEESYAKSYERAFQMLAEKELELSKKPTEKDSSLLSFDSMKQEKLTASTSWTHDDEEMYIAENSQDDHHGHRYENKDIFRAGDGDLQYNSFAAANAALNHLHRNQWSEGSCIENFGKKNSCFNSSTLYPSPIPARRNAEVPFTQPKSCFWGFNDRQRQQERMGRKGTSGGLCSRKVLFENPTMNGDFQSLPPDQSFDDDFAADASSESEETRTGSNYKAKYRSAAPDAVELEVPFTQPRSCSWAFNGGERLRKAECYKGFPGSSNRKLSFEPPSSTENAEALGNPSYERSELSRAVSDEPDLVDGVWKQTSSGDNEYDEVAMPYDYTHAGSPFTGCQIDSLTKKEECLQRNGAYEYITVDQKLKRNSLTVGGKKSWADMVEEEEDGGDNEEEREEEDMEEEESSTGRDQVNCLGDWSSSDEAFNDENQNSNILHQNHSPSNQVEDILSQLKLGSLDIKDGNRDDVISSRNPTVRRPLYFDQQPILDSTDNRHSSPLPRKDLATEVCSNSEQENNRKGDTMGGENVSCLTRRNRLQVFQEITVHQELDC